MLPGSYFMSGKESIIPIVQIVVEYHQP